MTANTRLTFKATLDAVFLVTRAQSLGGDETSALITLHTQPTEISASILVWIDEHTINHCKTRRRDKRNEITMSGGKVCLLSAQNKENLSRSFFQRLRPLDAPSEHRIMSFPSNESIGFPLASKINAKKVTITKFNDIDDMLREKRTLCV